MNYCCTTPQPAKGFGNITNAPLFVSNLRLQSNSPCINAGNNGYVATATDLGGNPRIVSATVEIGAYEYQGTGSLISYAWLQQYRLATDGSADFTYPDGDHYNNWQEWLVGSIPTNAASAPPFITIQPANQMVVAGSTATFSVMASPIESRLSYQWEFNGTNDIPGATTSSLTLSNVQSTDVGLYSVRVTNLFGSILSSNAVLQLDKPPLADASATRSLVISSNGVNATVVLDGSRSSDPDGDPLQYLWLLVAPEPSEGGSTPNSQLSTVLASGVVAVVVLPVGVSLVDLVVSDGVAASTNEVTVAVLTTSQAVERLIALVNQLGLAHPEPLVATLNAALASLLRGNSVAAANQLHAFQNKVGAQVAPSEPVLAPTLIAAAQQVIDAILSPVPAPLAAKVLVPKYQANGKVQLRFSCPTGRIHILEASTNLKAWEIIDVARDCGDGSFEFEDANAARLPNRFYRVLSP